LAAICFGVAIHLFLLKIGLKIKNPIAIKVLNIALL